MGEIYVDLVAIVYKFKNWQIGQGLGKFTCHFQGLLPRKLCLLK